ncbi:MAG TPA: hypothetical protein DCG70_06255, partial [Lachnoclostridium sp.]|nr:hypothetical protein [Lachnoclostridium sp.]
YKMILRENIKKSVYDAPRTWYDIKVTKCRDFFGTEWTDRQKICNKSDIDLSGWKKRSIFGCFMFSGRCRDYIREFLDWQYIVN